MSAGYTAAEYPLAGAGADQYTHDRADDMDDCPDCGATLSARHKCREERDR